MKRRKKGLFIAVWLLVVVLFVSVAATTIAYFDIMKTYMPDDKGAISLIPASYDEAGNADTVKPPESVQSDSEIGNVGSADVGSTEGFVKDPSFSVSDKDKTWTTETKVEIFRVSYENGVGEVTVQSEDGTKVIAPGTSNTYVFKLKNSGNVALDYKVELNADIQPNDVSIPLTARVSRHDGKWIAGDHELYVSAEQLDDAEDKATLGAGMYTYYTLEWCWPFEGDDFLDTALGNLATETDIIFAIEIVTTATGNGDPDAEIGIVPPPTGDDTRLTLWVTVAVSAFVLIVIILIIDRKQKKRDTAQEAKAFEAV